MEADEGKVISELKDVGAVEHVNSFGMATGIPAFSTTHGTAVDVHFSAARN